MSGATHRLHLLEYEAATDTGIFVIQEPGAVLDDEGVFRVLLGAPDPAYRDRSRKASVAIEATAEGDALAPVKGVVLGLALTIPLWSLLAVLVTLI